MYSTQETDSAKLRSRYRPLAGPFFPAQESLFDALLDHLVTSRARVIAANERGGVTIFRLRSECETTQQTAARIQRKGKR